MKAQERQALGKGLSALIAPPKYAHLKDDYFMCAIAKVRTDPNQPRQRFDDAALEELVASIKEKGILQPIVVRKDGDAYVVVAGERRLRAAKRVGLTDVPVVVKEVASEEAFELALIENIQREDLNAIEEAVAYQRLLERPGTTQEVLARRVGKDRTTVANALRLLKLDPDLQQLVIDGTLTAGHARSLLAVDDASARRALAARISEEGLSVRQAEAAVKLGREPAKPSTTEISPPPSRVRPAGPLQPYYDQVAAELSAALGVPVAVTMRGRRGQVLVTFQGVDELRKIREHVVKPTLELVPAVADGAR